MSDITAVVLTIGEPDTQRAIDSLKRQTLPPADIILIENVTPFHKAMNLGASKVKTEFFVQVDSDMVLDPDCFEIMRKRMTGDVAVVTAYLKDPLTKYDMGIKMFRTKCFEAVKFRDTISPDQDFMNDMFAQGWGVVEVGPPAGSREIYVTVGQHEPEITPRYTYSRFFLRGIRSAYIKDLGALFWYLKMLSRSREDVSLIAQSALAHGVFSEDNRDLLAPLSKDKDFEFLEDFFSKEGSFDVGIRNWPYFILGPRSTFKRYYKLGINLKKQAAAGLFKRFMKPLSRDDSDACGIAKLGLCQGLFLERYDKAEFDRCYSIIKKLFFAYLKRKKKLKIVRVFMPPGLQFLILFYLDMVKNRLKRVEKAS